MRVEELLDEGRVDEAEEYMKERWWRLRLGGYGVRKLNQAFFAFHGVYASSAASISPIGGQLEEMRSLVPSMGSFIKTLSRVSTYAEFLELLEGLRADAAEVARQQVVRFDQGRRAGCEPAPTPTLGGRSELLLSHGVI